MAKLYLTRKVKVVSGLQAGKIGRIKGIDKRRSYPYTITGSMSRFKASQLEAV